VLTEPNYILGAGPEGFVRLGALLDIVNGLTAIGTALALYSVVKRQHEGLAIGFVASRLFEAAILFIGIVNVLATVTLRRTAAATADPASLVAAGQSLVAVRDLDVCAGTGVPALNAFLLGTLMYRSRLVPRVIPVVGLIGAPLFTSWIIRYIFGITEGGTPWHAIGVAPIFLWELSLGLWMTFKGFNRSAPILAANPAEAGSHDPSAPAVAPRIVIATRAGQA
jgi:hypothetical protein